MLILLTVFSLSFLTCDAGNGFEEVFGEEDVITPETAAATCSTDSSLCVWTDFAIATTPADNNWASVTYGNGLFVATAVNVGAGNRAMVATWE